MVANALAEAEQALPAIRATAPAAMGR